MSPENREQILRDSADSIEEVSYHRPFDKEEMRALKDHLSELAIEKNKLEQEKKEAADHYKSLIKPVELDLQKTIHEVKLQSREVTEECFKVVDQEAGEVGYYNGRGMLVQQRPIHPDERQTNIFSLPKTGTDNQ